MSSYPFNILNTSIKFNYIKYLLAFLFLVWLIPIFLKISFHTLILKNHLSFISVALFSPFLKYLYLF